MKPLLAALLLATPLAALQAEENAPDGVPALVRTLKEQRDNAEVDLIKELANKRTREAMEGLLEVYPEMQSIYMRRAVLQGLALYDDVPGAEQPALEKLMNAATESKERELREAAIDLLGRCDDYGRAFLKMIVESPADDDIREEAMRLHVARAGAADREWYRSIFDPTAKEKAEELAEDRDEDDPKLPHQLESLRVLAFEALAAEMEEDDLVEAAEDRNRRVRAAALVELAARGSDEASDVAEDLWKRPGEPAKSRLVAARVMLDREGADVAKDLIDDATRRDASRELRYGVAELLVDLDDEDVNDRLIKETRRARGPEAVFLLHATRHLEDEDLTEFRIDALESRDAEIRRMAADVLGELREKQAVEPLLELVEDADDPLLITSALTAITRIQPNDAAWERTMVGYCESEEELIRNAAIEAVGRTRNPDYLDLLVDALDHESWSTRLAAAHAIEEMRVKAGVGALCLRIGEESGRMENELAEILFRLTGEPFGKSGRRWALWWENEGEDFEILSAAELREREREQEARRLKEITTTEFFGIRIESHRVIFVLDVSGSMNEPTRGKYLGEDGEPRIDVAKERLLKALDGLDVDSLFNIITFSSDVVAWRDRIATNDQETPEEAKHFVDRLRAGGGTNLFGALRAAFEDTDVDTIYVLSDGEPSVGEVTDPRAILDRVAAWNEHRGVVIHCIAVGGSLDVLELLAEQHGGTYVRHP